MFITNNSIEKIRFNLTNLHKYFQAHPYHMVDQSPWPFFISWTLFYMMSGAVSSMQGYWIGSTTFYLGLTLTLIIMSFWFNDVNIEGTISLTSNLLNHTLNLTRALSNEEINNFKNKLKIEKSSYES